MSALALVLCALSALVAGQSDPVARLQTWVGRARRTPRAVDERGCAELRAILGELRLTRGGGGDASELDLGLIELASLGASVEGAPAGLAASARLGRRELEDELERAPEPLATHLAQDVLDPARRRTREERLLAAQLLAHADAHVPSTLPSLKAAAREDDLDLARAAQTALCGWPDSSVHLFFLEELARGAPLARVAGEHFQRTQATLGTAVLEQLEPEVAKRYLSEDWREAARARALGRALDLPRVVPILIEALAAWNRRGEEGKGSKRIRAEILAELQRLSGRSIGADPGQWSAWWEGVRAKRIALPADIVAAGGQATSATFFGLHAVSDRVLFVVDRSGSMKTAFGTGGRSRHSEAIEQMQRFLRQSGADTRFNVALFSHKGFAWRNKLAPASEGNLELARRWLEDNAPDGETRLFEGLRAGLGLDERGRLDLERCEADTVIVLCDGATAEGAGWVAHWLAAENERAQLVFHCVQIGNGGDGTLEALAKATGGEFVHVQG